MPLGAHDVSANQLRTSFCLNAAKVETPCCVNPMWFKTMCFFAVHVYVPLYVAAIYAFIAGREFVRIPLMVWSGMLTLSLACMTAEQKWGEYASPRFDELFVPYVIFGVFSWFVVLRMLPKHPFTSKIVTKT